MNKNQIIKWIGIGRSKYFSWYGKDNYHNGKIPRDYWLLEEEKETIIKYYLSHSQEGYRAITYRMIDEDVIAVSPATTYRVLKKARLFSRWNNRVSSKGRGFKQPLEPHEHWHTDVSYININGTFYYFIGVQPSSQPNFTTFLTLSPMLSPPNLSPLVTKDILFFSFSSEKFLLYFILFYFLNICLYNDFCVLAV